MSKAVLAALVAVLLAMPHPALADTPKGDSGIGRGCTLDPFTHTMRCIDFDHCTRDKDGNLVCPVTTTPTRLMSRQFG